MKKLIDYCINITDGEHGTVIDDDSGDYYLLSNKNIVDGRLVITETDRRINRETFEKINKRTQLELEDVLIATVGTIGKTMVIDKPIDFVVQRSVGIIKTDKEALNPYYLKYLLDSPLMQKRIENAAKGAVQKCLFINDIKDLEVDIPPLTVQNKLVGLLKTIDDKIKNNDEICLELDGMMKLIYEYWFLQYEFPDEKGKPYKSSGGEMVWCEELNREIPKGWKVESLGNVFTSERGISYSTSNIEAGIGTPMVNLANFRPGGGAYKIDGLKYYLGEYPKGKKIEPFDLVMCNTQQTAVNFATDIIGRAMLVPNIFEADIVSSHHVNVIRTQDEKLKFYLLYLFNADFFHKYIAGYTNGTNILGLTFSGVENYLCDIPSQSILKSFADMVFEAEKKKSEILKENIELASLRDFLLPMLMNGQIGFKEA